MISKNKISGQHENEEIILHLRRHWFIFFRLFLFFVLLAVLPLGPYYMININNPDVLKSEILYPIILIVALSYYLILLVSLFTAWTDTYLDVWTVTTDRIINREQHGLFNRVVSELDIKMIQDVTAEQKGFFATIFYYGHVYVQSAGMKERFVFEQAPNPYKIAKVIQKLNERTKKNPGQPIQL